jgi:hypothetical protein
VSARVESGVATRLRAAEAAIPAQNTPSTRGSGMSSNEARPRIGSETALILLDDE